VASTDQVLITASSPSNSLTAAPSSAAYCRARSSPRPTVARDGIHVVGWCRNSAAVATLLPSETAEAALVVTPNDILEPGPSCGRRSKLDAADLRETDPAKPYKRAWSIQTVGPLPIVWSERVTAQGRLSV
jgi:hypothetical protein